MVLPGYNPFQFGFTPLQMAWVLVILCLVLELQQFKPCFVAEIYLIVPNLQITEDFRNLLFWL